MIHVVAGIHFRKARGLFKIECTLKTINSTLQILHKIGEDTCKYKYK